MFRQKDSVLRTKKAESIFRMRMIPAILILVGIYCAFFIMYDELVNVVRLCIGNLMCERIAAQNFGGLYDIQINLLVTAIATLSIIASFLNTRYLGANYKYWLFKHSPYMFTPQEIILLIVINQSGGLIYVVTGSFKLLAVLSFLICWYLFLYLMYQMYVYIIKVSHMFCKVRMQLADSYKRHKWNSACDRIYKKLMNVRYSDKRNSYLIEEIEIIIQMIIMYRDNKREHDRNSEKIENLKDVVLQLVKNEVYVRCDQYDCLKNMERARQLNKKQKNTIEKVYRNIVMDIIKRGNEIAQYQEYQITYQDKKSAEANLTDALHLWMGKRKP